MRILTDHQVNPTNDRLEITVRDKPGAGGANHLYAIYGFDGPNIPAGSGYIVINFQNGPIAEAGVNGVTQEALLAIVADRLRSFQTGPFSNGYNERALQHVEMALAELKARTLERMNRGVEGTHKL